MPDERPRPTMPIDETVITERHHAADLDVGAIARKVLAGEMELSAPVYRDTTNDPRSLQDAIDRIEHAQDVFEALPAKVRLLADNSVTRFAEILDDPDMLPELEAAGLQLTDEEPSSRGEAEPQPASADAVNTEEPAPAPGNPEDPAPAPE